MHSRRSNAGAIAGLLAVVAVISVQGAANGAGPQHHRHESKHQMRVDLSRERAADDAETLADAAGAIEQEALTSGALKHPVIYKKPARVLFLADVALINQARREDHKLGVRNTTKIMGAVPAVFHDQQGRSPAHRHIFKTVSLHRFHRSISDYGASGFGLSRTHDGATPALFRKPDGVDVEPKLPSVTFPTISEVVLRTAIGRLGLPYVWAAAGPTTFDCSGLVQWAYAHAGVPLLHYTGYQWNEGRKIKAADILPGDLILFGDPTYHVGMYLGAGWMINAPFTGQYVDVDPVATGGDIAGIIRP